MNDGEHDGMPSSWWKPGPLTYAMWVLLIWCLGVGWLASHVQVTGSDAAGNGMATAMTHGFAGLGMSIAGALAGSYLLIRWTPIRYVCLTLLLLLGLLMTILVR